MKLKKVFIPLLTALVLLGVLLSPIAAPVTDYLPFRAEWSVGQVLDPPGNPFAHSYSDVKDIRTATYVVAASNSEHRYDVDFKCDGVADDVTIEAAIAALPATGGRVLLLDGQYNITGDIHMTALSNITLEGQGDATVILKAANTNAIAIEDCHYIRIKNLKIDGDSTYTGYGIDIYSNLGVLMEGHRVEGCTIVDLVGANSTGIYVTYTNDAKIINNKVENCEKVGLWIDDTINSLVHGNLVKSCDEQGIKVREFTYPDQHIIISNNTCLDNGASGALSGIDLRSINYAVIANNICNGNTEHGIYVLSGSYATITGNSCYDNDSRGIMVYDNLSTTVLGNICKTNGTDGICLYGTTADCVVSNNICNANTDVGIMIEESVGYNTVVGNSCYLNEKDGICVFKSDYNNVIGNNCKDNGQLANNTYSDIRIWGTGAGANASEHNVVKGNVCLATLATKVRYNISEEAATDNYNMIEGNDVSAGVTATINSLGANSMVRNNEGWVTENSGTATLANGNTTIVVAHGLDVTPTQGDIVVTPIEHWGNMTFFYIDTFGAANFTITSDQDPGQDVDFAWKAIVL